MACDRGIAVVIVAMSKKLRDYSEVYYHHVVILSAV